jgi:hypothetical protein
MRRAVDGSAIEAVEGHPKGGVEGDTVLYSVPAIGRRSMDRRKDRRIRAALYCRPAGVEFLARQREPVDVSLGGIRIFSDDPLRVGELLKLEFFLPDVPPVTYTAEVVWIGRLEASDGGPRSGRGRGRRRGKRK